MARNCDGTFRNNNKSAVVRNSILIARWIEGEVVRLKILGVSFTEIAKQIIAVGRGRQRPLTPLPPEINFPADYSISIAACQKAFRRAIEREPKLGARELRRLFTKRGEALLLALQPAIQKGDVKAIVAAVRVLTFQATINNVAAAPEIQELPAPTPEPKPQWPEGSENLFDAAFKVIAEYGCLGRRFRYLPLSDPNAIDTTVTDPAVESK